MSLKWVDLNGLRDAIADVRNDKTHTNWVLAAYAGENSNDVVLVGGGHGGVNELISNLRDDIAAYGLVRVVERFDNSDTVKFVFIRWIGESIHRMLRARLGTHSGAVKEVFAPYHVDVEASNLSEISEDIITKTVSKASGTALHVRDTAASSSIPVTKSPSLGAVSIGKAGTPPVAGPPKATDTVKFHDEEGIRRAIHDLRNDATPTNWVLLTFGFASGSAQMMVEYRSLKAGRYDGPNSNTIVLAGSGTGGSEELIGHLRDDNVGYGIVRQDEKYDDSVRVMFACIL